MTLSNKLQDVIKHKPDQVNVVVGLHGILFMFNSSLYSHSLEYFVH